MRVGRRERDEGARHLLELAAAQVGSCHFNPCALRLPVRLYCFEPHSGMGAFYDEIPQENPDLPSWIA